MTATRLWTLAGLLAPAVYVLAVVAGGALTPGYSHVAGPIGALTMSGTPAAVELIPLFALYNALLIAFAFTMRDTFHERGVRISLLSPVALAVVAIVGVLMLLYPMDPLGRSSTETGRLHGFFAGIAALAAMVAVFFAARSLRRYPEWRTVAAYSFVSFGMLVVTGIWAASAAGTSPLMGLAERLLVAAFLQWVFVIALLLLRRPPNAAAEA